MEDQDGYVCSVPDEYEMSYYCGVVNNIRCGVGYMYGNQDEILEDDAEDDNFIYSTQREIYYGTEYIYDEEIGKFRLSGEIKGIFGSDVSDEMIGMYTCDNTENSGSCDPLHKVTRVLNTGDYDARVYYSYVWEVWKRVRSLGSNIDSSFSQLGIGGERTKYRLSDISNGIRLTCPNPNDRFTVNDEKIGNGDLTYPVGLLNADEAFLAGGYTSNSNYKYYLYTGKTYWTMSPDMTYGGSVYVKFANFPGLASRRFSVSGTHGVRPVINIRFNALNLGSGTWDDPYQVDVSTL